MKIYLDLVILINLFYDFLILLSVSILLKKNTKIKNIIASSLIGSISLITLFIPLSNLILLLFKIVLSIVMVLIAFGKDNFLEDIFYFYIITIILGGSSYLIEGNSYKVNIILMLIISPVIIYLYILNNHNLKLELSTIYDVILIDHDNIIKLRGIMDTGNNIKCNITNLPVIMINEKLNINKEKLYLVPYRTIKENGILECFKIDNVIINGIKVNCLLGLTKNINQNEVLLNNLLRTSGNCQ